MSCPSGSRLLACWLLGSLVDTSALATPSVVHEVIALQGQPPPDGSPGERFNGFSFASLDAAGDVVFYASTRQVYPLPSRYGHYLRTASGDLRLVARKGDAAPGVAGGSYDLFASEPHLDDTGAVGFSARLTPGPGIDNTNYWGIWGTDPGGALVLLARSGQPTAGLAGTLGTFSSHVDLRGPVGVAFANSAKDSNGTLLGHGIWTARADASGVSQQLVIFEGDPMPGGPAGAVVTGVSTPSQNARGQVAFRGPYRTSIGTTGFALFMSRPDGVLVPIVRDGDPVPGAPPGTLVSGLILQPPRLNDRGEVAFACDAGVVGPDGAGGLRLLPVSGPLSPGLVVWPGLSEAGEVAFRAPLASASVLPPEIDEGVWALPTERAVCISSCARETPPPAKPERSFATSVGRT